MISIVMVIYNLFNIDEMIMFCLDNFLYELGNIINKYLDIE